MRGRRVHVADVRRVENSCLGQPPRDVSKRCKAFTNFIVDAIYPGGKEAQYFGESWYTSFIKPASTTPVVRATIWAHDYRGILFSQPREQEGGQGFEVYVPIYRLSW